MTMPLVFDLLEARSSLLEKGRRRGGEEARQLKYSMTPGKFWESMLSSQITTSWDTNWYVIGRHHQGRLAEVFIKVNLVSKSTVP